MAEKKKKPQPQKAKADSKSEPGKADPKKITIVVIIILVIVAISVYVDYTVRNPRITNSTEASNRVFGQGVLANHPEIVYDTPVDIIESETPLEVGGKQCWAVYVTLYPDDPAKSKLFTYYVAASNGKIYTLDEATSTLIPYGV